MTDDVLARAKRSLSECMTPPISYPLSLMADLIDLVEAQAAEIDQFHSWDGLMSLLDAHWPEKIFPTRRDHPARDPGPRIISLLRTVEAQSKQLAAIREELAFGRAIATYDRELGATLTRFQIKLE